MSFVLKLVSESPSVFAMLAASLINTSLCILSCKLENEPSSFNILFIISVCFPTSTHISLVAIPLTLPELKASLIALIQTAHPHIGTTGKVFKVVSRDSIILLRDLSINQIHVSDLTANFTNKNIKNNPKT
jgi:hypothetical protein